ncbi:MAG TPA: tRNA pseudouridine(38-40) synthase TruA [Dissulfurispiraceae bacterium]|nr:tRNA pseudouridine(38-40) synthase TruA [Dissulfurispiraceae bacterium]
MKTVRMQLAYDGTAYHGWQIQPNGISVQQILQERLALITNAKTSVLSAGRTDAGVHALAQTVSFRTETRHSPDVFRRALNATLPHDIRILTAEEAPDDFHPRFDAKSKSYAYIVVNEKDASPFIARYAWTVPQKLDGKVMQAAGGSLVGRHDFTSFRASGCEARSTVRTVLSLAISQHTSLDFLGFSIAGDFFVFRIEADAFLRHMVRNIVGTLVEIGLGKRKADAVPELLLARDRSRAGRTAPACGLFLEHVNY